MSLGKIYQKHKVFKAVNILFALWFLFSISGCFIGRGDFPDTKLLSGEVRTKNGKYPIVKTEYWARFHSSFEQCSMNIMPFKNINSSRVIGTLEFWMPGKNENYTAFTPTNAFYQINKESKIPIELDCKVHGTSSNGNTKITCNYPLPDILAYPSRYHISEGMLSSTKAKLEPKIKDTYRFNMNFIYNEDNNPITIDLRFKLKLRTRLYSGIPGGYP